jgi:hypothetical protein
MGSTQIAEVYARLSKVEGLTTTMEEVTAVRFREIQQDVERLDSNSETQKKFMAQELLRIEGQTQSAVDRTQSQIDSLRQQTTDMHTSLSSIHHHSETLTDGLKTMMESFQDLRFDLPNAFDNWMKVREGRVTGTVTGSELQPWNARRHTPLPNLPPLVVTPPPPPTSVAFQQEAPTSNTAVTESLTHSVAPNSATAPDSPNDPYQAFIQPDLQGQSDAMLDLQANLDHGDEQRMDVGPEGMELGVSSGTAPSVLSASEGSQFGNEEEGNANTVDDVGGDQLVPKVESRQDSIPPPTPTAIGRAPTPLAQEVEEEAKEGVPASRGTSVPQNLPSQRLSPSQRTPPSTPPTFIRNVSVPPPAGLLVSSNSVEVLPPSSQPSNQSPSPQADFRLLNAPPDHSLQRAPSSSGNELQGRITRSRSGSVSNPPQQPGKPPSQSRRKSARNGASSRR